jgi:hypothetical protein
MKLLDIVVLMLISIIVIAIITLNFNTSLDNKISNMSVNIPPINIPETDITVKIQKECNNNDYDVFIEKKNNSTLNIVPELNKNTYVNTNIEPFGQVNNNNNNNNNKEHPFFNNISKIFNKPFMPFQLQTKKPEQLSNIQTQQKSMKSQIQHFTTEENKPLNITQTQTQQENIIENTFNNNTNIDNNNNITDPNTNLNNKYDYNYPSYEELKKYQNNIIDEYDDIYDPKKNINENNYAEKHNINELSKCNSSIANKKIEALGKGLENKYMTLQNNDNDNNNCNYNENIINNINDEEWDPNEFYKKHQIIEKSYLEDYKTRGYNIFDFDDYGTIYNIGKIDLKYKETNDPKGYGYMFKNSSSYNR